MTKSTTILTRILIFTILYLGSLLLVAGQVVTTSVLDGVSSPSVSLASASGNPNIGDFGTINLYNGSLNYTIPLLNINSRGGADYGLSLSINRLWAFEYSYECVVSQYNECSFYARSTVLGGGAGIPKYTPGMLESKTIFPHGNECPSQGNGLVQSMLTFTSQDGSQINLFSPDYPLGANTPCISAPSPGQEDIWYGVSVGNTFVSLDGSGLTFVSDFPSSSTKANVAGFLYTANGSRFRIDDGFVAIDYGFVTKIEDRNGNLTSFTYEVLPYTNRKGKLLSFTDSNGGITTISYGLHNSEFGFHDEITYPGFNGSNKKIRITYGELGDSLRTGEILKNLTQLVGDLECPYESNDCPSLLPFNPGVVRSIIFPENKTYHYKYNSYAEIARVETPSGVAFEYDWGGSLDGGLENGRIEYDGDYPDIFRQVLEKRVYPNGSSGSQYEQKIEISKIANLYSPYESLADQEVERTVKVLNASDVCLGVQKIRYQGHPLVPAPKPDDLPLQVQTFPDFRIGQDIETRMFKGDGATLIGREMKERIYTTISNSIAPVSANPRITKQLTISFDGTSSLISLNKADYDTVNPNYVSTLFADLNLKRQTSYAYKYLDTSVASTSDFQTLAALFNNTDVVSLKENDYEYGQSYRNRHLFGLVTETRILNPTNTNEVLAKSQFVYDETTYFDNNYTTTNWVDPNSTLRGNVTTVKTWNADTNSWIETHTMFDNFGNVRKVWDASGDANRFVETQYDSAYKYAYPTKTIAKGPDPNGITGMSESSEITRVFDFNTGVITSVTDANGQAATTEYDELLRPIRSTPPSGGSISEVVYNDTPGDLWVKSRQQIDQNNWAESTTYFDNLGRPKKSITKDLIGDVVTEIRYDSFGRLEKKSNPYRVDTNGTPTETVYWSKVRYDDRGRVVETYAPAIDGQTGMSLGTVDFGISSLSGLVGTYVIATDASGRKSRSISGIYGLMRIDEATSMGGTVENDLGTLSSPHQPTYYNYNIKGELTKITHGQQIRYFKYDSLGRLIRVRQPEQTPNANLATTGNPENDQWTAAYSYDVHGNVVSMTDAKDTTITNFYDNAGRTTKRTYTDGTPQVEFFYDGKGLSSVPQFSRGALTKAISSVSEDRFTEFDNHGRLLASQQITDGETYPFEYKYNLSGGLLEQTYPSGRVVKNFLDSDGGLSVVNTKAVGGLLKQMASDFDYASDGSIKKMKLGNGLWETAQFNEMAQLMQVGLGTAATSNDLFKIDYEYGELSQDGTAVDAAKNIGMIARTTTTIPTTSFVQTFKYDAINRLTEAKEKTGATTNWVQTFGYDRFGNRTQFSETVNSIATTNTAINHPTIDAANNRFTTGQGYVYDYNGNIIADAEGRSFTFNGDDKQTEVKDTNNNVVGQYFYDGSGARVKKYVPSTGETTVFVYDAGGALAAEYSTIQNPEPTTSYLTTDHLGSPRVITDGHGEVISRRDFMPFGEDLHAGVGGRSTNLKYSLSGTDNIRKRFTGYEKDDETGLDFAEARMYQNRHGRFTAPDPLLASADPINPQTFNRYIYTGNNPVNNIDPTGLDWCKTGERTGNISWKPEGCSRDSTFNVDDTHQTCINRAGCSIPTQSGGTSGTVAFGESVWFDENGTASRVLRLDNDEYVEVRATDDDGTNSDGNRRFSFGGGGVNNGPSLGCGPGVSYCGGPITNRPIERLDPSKAPGTNTVKIIRGGFEACAMLPGIGTACALAAVAVSVGQGDAAGAGDNLLGVVPFGGLRKLDKAADIGKGAHVVYEGIDAAGVVRYVGITSRGVAARASEHLRAVGTGKELLKYRVVKGYEGLTKLDARIIEQKLINNKGLANLLNKRNEIAKRFWKMHGIE